MKLTLITELQEDGSYVARVREFPACAAEGVTREEALENVRETIDSYFEHAEGPFDIELAEGEDDPEAD